MTTIYRCKAYTCIHNEDGCILEEIIIDGGYCCQEYIARTKENE